MTGVLGRPRSDPLQSELVSCTWMGHMRIKILSTGGTIEKTFDERDGTLRNIGHVLDHILAELRLPSLDAVPVAVMAKDSLELADEDRQAIRDAILEHIVDCEGIVIVHGTDTLEVTGEYLFGELAGLDKPVVLTGAMRPYEFRDSDAYQNLTEALLASRLLPPGVYVVMHNQALRFPGVVKDRQRMTFAQRDPAEPGP